MLRFQGFSLVSRVAALATSRSLGIASLQQPQTGVDPSPRLMAPVRFFRRGFYDDDDDDDFSDDDYGRGGRRGGASEDFIDAKDLRAAARREQQQRDELRRQLLGLGSPRGTRPGDPPPGARGGTRPGDSPSGARGGTRPGDSSPGARGGTRPGDSSPGARGGTRPGDSSAGADSAKSSKPTGVRAATLQQLRQQDQLIPEAKVYQVPDALLRKPSKAGMDPASIRRALAEQIAESAAAAAAAAAEDSATAAAAASADTKRRKKPTEAEPVRGRGLGKFLEARKKELELSETIFRGEVTPEQAAILARRAERDEERRNAPVIRDYQALHAYEEEMVKRVEKETFNTIPLSMRTFYRDDRIRFNPVILIGPDGTNLGEVDTPRALSFCRRIKAHLVLVSTSETGARPPIARMFMQDKVDFSSTASIQNAKSRARKAEAVIKKTLKTKEIRFSVTISKSDAKYRIEQARKFVEKGHPVQFVLEYSNHLRGVMPRDLYAFANFLAEEFMDIAREERGVRIDNNLVTFQIVKKPAQKTSRALVPLSLQHLFSPPEWVPGMPPIPAEPARMVEVQESDPYSFYYLHEGPIQPGTLPLLSLDSKLYRLLQRPDPLAVIISPREMLNDAVRERVINMIKTSSAPAEWHPGSYFPLPVRIGYQSVGGIVRKVDDKRRGRA
ncbi:hypothetical protein H696_01437 [Fonticula alba]|uniref:Translation initiation factor 3 N-terminal domain-containing protein n=1 Tax=Fonticula alba TaxID=691883 RepID=A0A058ZDJ8_FONAL|nr:hypothetical protein H696_01437 [Fonticula alba]KCV72031.1 hypothetical protein H696_01437 [Fonticula alba]|eukprot:XP_009493609.1 hypothetical protein H696_01437 [Fonticula alba]